jgi:hypothetical protein
LKPIGVIRGIPTHGSFLTARTAPVLNRSDLLHEASFPFRRHFKEKIFRGRRSTEKDKKERDDLKDGKEENEDIGGNFGV